MTEFITHEFPNIGYIMGKFTDEQMAPIHKEVDNIIKNKFDGWTDHRHELAGNLEKEFAIPNLQDDLEKLLMPLIVSYDQQYNYLQSIQANTKDNPIRLQTPWINFQQKNEYNPPHTHSGVFSFALWVKIPYDIADELKVERSVKSNSNHPGFFNFHYIDALGNMHQHSIPADKSYANRVVVFPSKMTHSVNPFTTSDDYRISISGNFKIDVDFVYE